MKVLSSVIPVSLGLEQLLVVFGAWGAYLERDAALGDGLVDEHRDSAGHGESEALEERLRRAFGVVVDSEVYLCHGAFSPCGGDCSRFVSQMSINHFTFNALDESQLQNRVCTVWQGRLGLAARARAPLPHLSGGVQPANSNTQTLLNSVNSVNSV